MSAELDLNRPLRSVRLSLWFFLTASCLVILLALQWAMRGAAHGPWVRYAALSEYQPVQATISKVSSPDPHYKDRRLTTKLSYTYEVDGEAYQGKALWSEKPWGYSSKEIVEHFRDGQITTAYVKVDNPSEAVLLRCAGMETQAGLLWLCWGTFFFLFAVLVLVGAQTLLGVFRGTTPLFQRRAALVCTCIVWFLPLAVVGPYWALTIDWPIYPPTAWAIWLYVWLGLLPFGGSLPDRGHLGQLRQALIFATLTSLFGAGLSSLIGWTLGSLVSSNPQDRAPWVLYGAFSGAILFAVGFGTAAFSGRLRYTRQGPQVVEDKPLPPTVEKFVKAVALIYLASLLLCCFYLVFLSDYRWQR